MPHRRALLAAMALAPAACAAQGRATLAPADADFVAQAASGGIGEMARGRQAQRSAASPAVQDFARRMRAEHGAAHRELVAIAARAGMVPPAALDPRAAQAAMQLSLLSGPGFDRSYMAHQVREQELQLALFRRQAEIGTDPELRAFAARGAPMIERHAAEARQVLAGLAAPAR